MQLQNLIFKFLLINFNLSSQKQLTATIKKKKKIKVYGIFCLWIFLPLLSLLSFKVSLLSLSLLLDSTWQVVLTLLFLSFQQVASGSSDGKDSTCNAGDMGLFPGLGRSPGEGNGKPLQYSCLENSVDRGAWWAIVHGVTESDMTEQLTHTHTHFCSHEIT